MSLSNFSISDRVGVRSTPDRDASHRKPLHFIQRVSRKIGISSNVDSDVGDSSRRRFSVVKEEVEAKYDSKYTLFLTLHSKEDQREFHEFNKNNVYAPVFWFFIILVGGIDMSRLSLTEMFHASAWFQATCFTSVAAIVVFFIFAVSQLGRLTGFYFGDNFRIQRLCSRLSRVLFADHTEDAITILFSLAICSFLIARVEQGQCPYSNTVPKTTIFCNPDADSLSPPIDTVIAAYIHPLVLHMAIKGISKWAMILAWSIATATVLWSIVFLSGWLGIYSILDSLFFLLVIYETHRLKILVSISISYHLPLSNETISYTMKATMKHPYNTLLQYTFLQYTF